MSFLHHIAVDPCCPHSATLLYSVQFRSFSYLLYHGTFAPLCCGSSQSLLSKTALDPYCLCCCGSLLPPLCYYYVVGPAHLFYSSALLSIITVLLSHSAVVDPHLTRLCCGNSLPPICTSFVLCSSSIHPCLVGRIDFASRNRFLGEYFSQFFRAFF